MTTFIRPRSGFIRRHSRFIARSAFISRVAALSREAHLIAQALKGRPYNSPGKVQRSGTQPGDAERNAGDAIRSVLHIARRTGVPRCTGSIPREKQGGVSYPALTHGAIIGSPLQGLRRIKNFEF